MNSNRSFYFIKNPAAGRSAVRAKLNQLLCRLKEAGCRIEGDTTEYPGHARDLAERRSVHPDEIYVSAGGDGTFNEIASAKVNTDAVVAILPFGSGNGMARSLRVRNTPSDLLRYLCEGKPGKVDAGTFAGKKFFCTSGIGFDARVAAEFNAGKTRGLSGYIYTVLQTFFKYRPVAADLLIDGTPFSGRYFLVTFANAPQYGNNAIIAPAADLSDGYLDVTFIRPFPKVFIPLVVLSLFTGMIHRMPWVNTVKTKEIEILNASSEFFHYDGESTRLSWPVTIRILPGAIRVLRR